MWATREALGPKMMTQKLRGIDYTWVLGICVLGSYGSGIEDREKNQYQSLKPLFTPNKTKKFLFGKPKTGLWESWKTEIPSSKLKICGYWHFGTKILLAPTPLSLPGSQNASIQAWASQKGVQNSFSNESSPIHYKKNSKGKVRPALSNIIVTSHLQWFTVKLSRVVSDSL